MIDKCNFSMWLNIIIFIIGMPIILAICFIFIAFSINYAPYYFSSVVVFLLPVCAGLVSIVKYKKYCSASKL